MAAVNAVARAERAALCDLFDEVGPDAPTLCGSWRTRDLAAHLVVRERRLEAIGIGVAALRGRMEHVQDGLAQQPWAELVGTVRQGPPFWNPMGIAPLDAQTNTVEFFVHHEDVRRACEGWEPRALASATTEALWKVVPTTLRAIASRIKVGIDLVPTDGPAAGSTTSLTAGESRVRLHGTVGEIVLAVYGRPTRDLDIDGEAAAVESFLSSPR